MSQKQNGPVTNRSCKGQLSSVQRILACSKGPWLVGQHHGPRMHAIGNLCASFSWKKEVIVRSS